MTWPVSPWRSALSDERCLPAAVRGPVECAAFARFTSARLPPARRSCAGPWLFAGALVSCAPLLLLAMESDIGFFFLLSE